jgi:hypothetical protein
MFGIALYLQRPVAFKVYQQATPLMAWSAPAFSDHCFLSHLCPPHKHSYKKSIFSILNISRDRALEDLAIAYKPPFP